jgi:hypothetical protein
MCAADEVTVFGICPGNRQAAQGALESPNTTDSSAEEEMEQMKSAVEMTGGKFYDRNSSLTAEQILDDIASRTITDTNTAIASLDKDTPLFWLLILIAGFILGTVAERSNGIAVPAAAHIAINLRTFLYSGVIPETLISTIDIFVIAAGIISAAVLFILTKKLPTYEKTTVREETVREEAEFDDWTGTNHPIRYGSV